MRLIFSQDYTPAAETGYADQGNTPNADTFKGRCATQHSALCDTASEADVKSFKHRRDCMMMVTGFASFQT